MKSNTTFTASIYVGLQHGYSGGLSSIDDVRQWLQKFCNEVKLGLTLTPTEFIYVGGGEPGVIIGLINYPRFPQSVDTIKKLAITIGEGLMKLLSQERISIVFQMKQLCWREKMSDLDYDFDSFMKLMKQTTENLQKMNAEITYMRYQFGEPEVYEEFVRAMDDATGSIHSHC